MGVERSREIARLREKLGIEVLWVHLLALLKKGPAHAYALRKKVEAEFGFLPGNVSVYVVLYKLQSRGFVATRRDENRVVYSITPRGRQLLSLAGKEFRRKLGQLFS
jgi:DNA-binding PadR family transcriptional regulator